MTQTQTPCAGPTMAGRGDAEWRFNWWAPFGDERVELSDRQQRELQNALDEFARERVDAVLERYAPCATWIPATGDILTCRAHAGVIAEADLDEEIEQDLEQVNERVQETVLEIVTVFERSAAA